MLMIQVCRPLNSLTFQQYILFPYLFSQSQKIYTQLKQLHKYNIGNENDLSYKAVLEFKQKHTKIEKKLMLYIRYLQNFIYYYLEYL